MALTFPNAARVFDATRRAVRFWGHDRSMEFTFFVAADALQGMEPKGPHNEGSVLAVFDSNRERIHKAAARVYARGRQASYDLAFADL